jgi:hypothetical protein
MKTPPRARKVKRKTLLTFIRAQIHHPLMRLAWEYELGLRTQIRPDFRAH